MFFFISFLVLLELAVLGAGAQCYEGEEASWELKRWVLTELAVEDEVGQEGQEGQEDTETNPFSE